MVEVKKLRSFGVQKEEFDHLFAFVFEAKFGAGLIQKTQYKVPGCIQCKVCFMLDE